jgi:hypothetical protein
MRHTTACHEASNVIIGERIGSEQVLLHLADNTGRSVCLATFTGYYEVRLASRNLDAERLP